MTPKKLKLVSEKIKNSKHLVIFTGAGVSAESGIPTFRGNSGIYNDINIEHLELSNYVKKPKECFNTIKKLFTKIGETAEPNIGHKILADWEISGLVKCIITQNVDNLHQEAGSKVVYELHGNGKELRCLSCGNIDHLDTNITEEDYPKCKKCGELSKPSFTFFGEKLPEEALKNAEIASKQCDVMIIIGCSGIVYPAAGLPLKAKSKSAFIIEINPTVTNYTDIVADITLSGNSVEVLSKLDKLIKKQK